MATRKRKMTPEEKAEIARLKRLMEAEGDEIEEEVEVEEDEDGEEIIVIRGNAARSLIAKLQLGDDEDEEEEEEETPPKKKTSKKKADEEEEEEEEEEGDIKPDEKPKSGHRFFR